MTNALPYFLLTDPMGQFLCASGALELGLQRPGEQSPFAVRRNAGGAAPTTQIKLRDQVRALVGMFGYRPDFLGSNPPWQVPWTPAPIASEIVRWLSGEANRWLDAGSIYDEAKQPEFIRRYWQQLMDAAGRWAGGPFLPTVGNYESAPFVLVNQAPKLFPTILVPGMPLAAVLKAEPSWRFWFAAQALAIHFDALGGAPTKLQIFGESVAEAIKELPSTIASAGTTIQNAIGLVLPWKAILIVGGAIASAVLLPPIVGALRGSGR